MKTNSPQQQILGLLVACIALLLSTTACSYTQDDDYAYTQLATPTAHPIDIQLGYHLPNELRDTIYLYTTTTLPYSIDTHGKTIYTRLQTIPGATLSYPSPDSITIAPLLLDDANHVFDISLILKSHTTSLADIESLERITQNYAYNIKLVSEASWSLHLRETTSPTGNLQIEWDNPNLPQAEVAYYELYKNNQLLATISNPDRLHHPSYTDPSYAYGSDTYSVQVVFKNKRVPTRTQHIGVSHSNIGQYDFSVRNMDNQTVKIAWQKNAYACRYVLVWNKKIEDGEAPQQGILFTTDHEVIFPYIGNIPSAEITAQLYVLPTTALYAHYPYYPAITASFVER